MTSAILLLLVGVLAILAIIAANAYFVAQEFAFMSVDRARLAAKAESGDARAEAALKVTRRTSFMLSGAQLGITVTGLLVGYVAEPLVGEGLGTLLGGAGVPAGVSISVGTITALVLATGVQMIFAELYPKNLAIANAEPVALRLARSTNIYLTVFGWLITFFDWSANAILRLVRIEPVHDLESSATAEDLERIVADSRSSGDLPEGMSILIDRILDFPGRDVEHAMVPRSRVDVVRGDLPVAELRARMAREHTRYPVVDEGDEPIGLVDLRDVLRSRAGEGAVVSDLMREAVIVPELMALPDAVDQLTEAGHQMACVVDEYGGFTGMVTLEDLAEELVGEVTDEHEEDSEDATAVGDDTWVVTGDLAVDELARSIGRSLPEGDFETVAGLLIAEHGDLLEEGASIEIRLPDDPRDLVEDDVPRRHLDVEVIEVDRHVPSRVRVRYVETVESEDEG